jgi:hypothetical protein
MDAMPIKSLAAAALVLAACALAQAQDMPPPLSGAAPSDTAKPSDAANLQGAPSPPAEPKPQAAPAPSGELSPQAGPAPQMPPMPDISAPQSVPTPNASDHYVFDHMADLLLRLDTTTGEVSVCKLHTNDWACEVVPDDRVALENEIERLQNDVDALKAEVAALREPPPPRPPADLTPPSKDSKDNDVTIKLPTHEDIARAGVVVGKAWQKLVDMIVGFRNDVMRKS